MAASDFDFNLTRTQVIERAFRMCGGLSTGQSLTANQITQGNIALNAMVKDWQNEHVFLWTVRESTLPLVNGAASYAIEDDPDTIDILKASIRQSGYSEQFLEVIPYSEYWDIPNKDTSGTPTHICIDARLTPTVYFYPTPDSNAASQTAAILGIVKLKDFDTASGNPDATQRWLNALCYGLAAELAPELGLSLGERQALERKAQEKFMSAKKGDHVNTTRTVVAGYYSK